MDRLRKVRDRLRAVARRRKQKRHEKRIARRKAARQREIAARKAKAQSTLGKAAARLRKLIKRIREDLANDWPDSLVIAELLYHQPGPHIHLATPERDKLIAICKIAQRRGLRVGEFPPFDVVECVHVSGSWHYRDSSSPSTPRDCANRGNGLAADLNDADGGSDQEVAFYQELVRRYR